MGRHEKRNYLEIVRDRYKNANKEEKCRLITELCATYDYHRKHAIRLLNQRPLRRKKAKCYKGRPRYDKGLLLPHLKKLWFATGQMCSKKLRAALPHWLPWYRTDDTELPDVVVQSLQSLSAATIDRWLKPYRSQGVGKRFCSTKPGTLLKNQIPIKTDNWDVARPGFLEADTVAHCGNSLAGDFAWSVTFSDICSTWTEIRAIWNKGAEGVIKSIEDIKLTLPFAILGFDSDNGSEFLNHHLVRYFSELKEPITFTRSRPYHKNDNAHVEQKNWTHVRQLFGYDRFDNLVVVERMNDLYRNEWSAFCNHFSPTMKLIEKTRVNSRYKKKYDTPTTPYHHLINSDWLTKETRLKLEQYHQTLNPFELQRLIQLKLKRIFELIAR
jgi:hypothetical protein